MYLTVHTAVYTDFLCFGGMYPVVHTATFVVFLFLWFGVHCFDGGVVVMVLI